MISETFHHFEGIRAPFASYPLEAFAESGQNITFVAMNQEEYEYLGGMQYIIGSKFKIVLFQDFHDKAYDRRREMGLDEFMRNIACSYPHLHDLMITPYGDLIWAKKEKERKEPTYYIGNMRFV